MITDVINDWVATQPAGTVVLHSKRSPNGSPTNWDSRVPEDQTEIESEEGYEEEVDANGVLHLRSCPKRGQHMYYEFSFVDPCDHVEKIIESFRGGDAIRWTDVKTFATWLTGRLGLEADSDGFKACMAAGLREAADELED